MALNPKENSPDSRNSPQEDLLKQAYQKVTKKITSAHKTTVKALSEVKAKIYKELVSQYKFLKKFAEKAEKIASAREAVDWALNQLKTEDSYKEILAKKGITLRSADFYLGLVRKESGFNQQAVSNGNAKGLFQILVRVDEKGNESSLVVDDINKFYGLESKVGDLYYANGDKDSRKIAAQNNALVGILFWHMCRDNYGNKIKSDLSSDDKDKLGNMIYNMGSGDVKRLWQALGNPKDFKKFGTTLAEKLHEAYPDDLENKTESVQDRVLETFYDSYIKIGKGFDEKTVTIEEEEFSLPKIFEAIKYAELVFSLNHVKPKAKAAKVPTRVKPKAPEKSERLGPTHILKGQTLMILDSITPSYFIIDTKGIKEKMKFKQAVSVSDNGKGKNLEHDCIQVKVDGLEGYFQMENGKNMSLWPLNKGGLWDNYNIHLDDKANVIMIAPKKPKTIPTKPSISVQLKN